MLQGSTCASLLTYCTETPKRSATFFVASPASSSGTTMAAVTMMIDARRRRSLLSTIVVFGCRKLRIYWYSEYQLSSRGNTKMSGYSTVSILTPNSTLVSSPVCRVSRPKYPVYSREKMERVSSPSDAESQVSSIEGQVSSISFSHPPIPWYASHMILDTVSPEPLRTPYTPT